MRLRAVAISLYHLIFLSLLFPPFLSAQEYESAEIEEEGLVSPARESVLQALERLSVSVFLQSEFHTFNNLDLLPLDETSEQSIIDTDDGARFGYTFVAARLRYAIERHLAFNLGLSLQGLWGNDQIGSPNRFGSIFYFSALNFDYEIGERDRGIDFRIGRQYFRIGGTPKDYFLKDILDAAVVVGKLGKGGDLRIMAFDFYASGESPDEVNFVRYLGQGTDRVEGMRGDTNTFRYGAIYENDRLVENLDAKLFLFFADIGAIGTGADITFNGEFGNFADNDWALMSGGRAAYEVAMNDRLKLRCFGEFARAEGTDRKEDLVRDVDIGGNAFSGGLELAYSMPKSRAIRLSLQGFHADGPDYASDGLPFSHGFVSFKGDQVGGINLDRYAGWHPSAYVGSGGIDDTPQNVDRKSGTRFVASEVALRLLSATELRLGAWFLWDTGHSFLADRYETPEQLREALDSGVVEVPFGISREEFFAEARLGKYLGTEYNVGITYEATPALSVYGNGGIFLPGAFYEIPIDRIAGSALGSTDPANFWTVSFGTKVLF